MIEERIVAVYSVATAKRQAHQREELINRAQKMLQNQTELRRQNKVSAKVPVKRVEIDPETGKKTKKKEVFVMDEDRIADLKKWEGLNMIITSETGLRPFEILGQYHELWQIEETFKISKTDLEGRPIHHRLDKKIQGHFLTCFISLVIFRLLQKKTGGKLTKEQLFDALRRMNCTHLESQYYRNCAGKNSIEWRW